MDFKKSKALLKKINVLHDSALDFEGSMSAMERDLLLQYLRNLYEMILHESPSGRAATLRETRSKSIEQAAHPPVSRYEDTKVESTLSSQYRDTVDAIDVQPDLSNIKPEGGKKKEKLAVLFESDDSKDLKSKFGSLPISDIAKSMGINDKILTINELFDGDQSLFNHVVKELNSFGSFAEAKQFLISGVAKKQGWYEDQKKGKAITFIRLIRRRYI